MNHAYRLLFLAALALVLSWQFGRAVAEVARPFVRATLAWGAILSTSIVW